MGRGKKLTETEKGKISTFREVGESIHSIARKIGRSRGVVSNFLQNNIAYGTKYVNCGRKNILSPRTKRKIANEASNSTKSAELIKGQLNLDASRTTVWRAIKENSNIIRSKMNVCLSMKPHNKIFSFSEDKTT